MYVLKTYYELTKPGIIYGNAITAAAGFFLVAAGSIDWALLAFTLLGLSLVVASGCVFNNIIDRDIDVNMERTKARATVQGSVRPLSAFIYALLLGIAGFALLALFAGTLATLFAALGFIVYVPIYSMWAKRHTGYATHIGAIAGAVPPVVGYTAVSHQLDVAALLLFALLFFWQITHFFAIVVRRHDEYTAAGVPAWPLTHHIQTTRAHMLFFAVMFIISALALYTLGYAGAFYLTAVLLVGLLWLAFVYHGAWKGEPQEWARRVFLFSLVALFVVSGAMALDAHPSPYADAFLIGTSRN